MTDVLPEHEIRDQVRLIVLELAPNPDPDAGGDWSLIDQLEYQSLALLELAFALEDEFDLESIDEQTARGIQTIKDVEDHVVRELLGAAESDLAGTT
jgi:acyl carrier protein